jgi:Ca2+-binding EF-hand superfamily protein
METAQKEATQTLVQAFRDYREKRIHTGDLQTIMDTLRSRMSEAEWTAVKFRAAANDR